MKFKVIAVTLLSIISIAALGQAPVAYSPSGPYPWGTQTTFSWSSVPGASSYYVEISRYNTFDWGATWGISNISGTTVTWNNLANPNNGETFYWRVRVSNSSTWSNVRSYTYTDQQINYYININQPSSPISICAGGSVFVSGSSNYSGGYSWTLPGATPSSLNSSSGTVVYNTPGTYNITFRKGSHTETEYNYITVLAPPDGNIIEAPNNGRFCQGGQITLTEAHIHENGDTYQWLLDGNNIQGATDTTLTVTSPGNYSLEITNNSCASISNVIPVQYFNADLLQSPTTYHCDGHTVPLTSSTGVPGCSYVWYKDGNVVPGASDSILTVMAPGDYYVVADMPGGGCPTTSQTITVQTNTTYPTADILQGTSTNLCIGDTAELNAYEGVNYTYQWLFNDVVISGADSTSIMASQSGEYTLQTNYNNCISYDTLEIIPIDNPIVTIEPTPGCNGLNQYVRAVSPNATQFNWHNGMQGDSIFLINPGFVKVIAIDNNGCDTEAEYFPDPCYCLGGTYRVGPTGEIPDIQKLNGILDTACTMTGPATFLFETGTYAGRITQSADSILGNTAARPITFESESGIASDVVIEYDSTTNRGGLGFKSKYMNLKNMTFTFFEDRNGHVVSIGNFDGDPNDAAYVVDNVHVIGDSVRGMEFDKGKVTLTNSSIECHDYEGVFLDDCIDVKLINNEIKFIEDDGIRLYDCINVHLKGNKVKYSQNVGRLKHAINLFRCGGEIIIEKNLIQTTNSSGICVTSPLPGANNTLEVSNNMVCMYTSGLAQFSSTSITSGISLLNLDLPTKVYHNSVSNRQLGAPDHARSVAFRIRFEDPYNNSGFDMVGNSSYGLSTNLYMTQHDPSYNINMDYNNWYQTNNNHYQFAINNTAYGSINVLRNNTDYEDHGVSRDPEYVSMTFTNLVDCDLHTGNNLLRNIGDPSIGVFDDYDGHARYQPDLGADELTVADLEMTDLSGVSPSSCQGVYDFSNDSIFTVTMVNNGYGPFPGGFPLVVSCTVNNVVQVSDTVVLSADWPQGQTMSHTFSQAIHLLPNGPNDITVSIGHHDDVPGNDAINQLAGNYAPPVADFNVSSQCQDAVVFENISTTPAGTLTYNWDFGDGNTSSELDPTHSYTSTGNQTVTLMAISNTGCQDTTEQVIDVYPAPNVSLSPLSVVCIYHQPFSLSNGSPSGGTYSGNGVNNGYFNPDAAGLGNHIITYSYTNSDGCSDQSSTVLQVSECVGVEEYELGNLQVYPNPTHGFVNIELPQGVMSGIISNGNIKVNDIRGKLVYNSNLQWNNNPRLTLDLNGISPGVYFLELTVGEKSGITKLVISE